MKTLSFTIAVLSVAALLGLMGCTQSNSSTTPSTSFGTDVPNYVADGTESTNIDSNVPGWIKDNFKNIRAYVSGNTIVIETRSYPPYKTYYYGSSSAYYDASTIPSVTNPNTIAQREITMTVPLNPTISASTLDSTKSSAGLGIIGIAVNGVALFNDDANTNAGDEIVNEVPTMDSLGGHPTEHGVYHYHIEPAVLSKTGKNPNGDTAQSGDELLGIAIDGLPIFGPKDSTGVLVFDAGGVASKANTANYRTNDNWIAASAQTNPPSLYANKATNGLPDVHYQVVVNFYLATTKAMTATDKSSIPVGTIEPDFYMIGDYIAGTKGSSSDGVTP